MKYKNCVLIIVFFGLILRIININFQSLWLDEIVSISISNPENNFLYVYEKTIEGAPTFFQVLLWSWFKVFTYNEFFARFFSVFFGTLSIFFIYLLGKEMFNKKTGLISSLIISLNQFSIYYSQETRAYSLLMFLSIFSSYLYLLMIRKKTNIFIFLYLISSLLLIHTHYFGSLVVFSHLVYYLIYDRNKVDIRIFFIGFVIILIGLIPLIQTTFNLSKINDFWISKPKYYFILTYFHSYFKNKILTILFFLLVVYGLFKNYKKKDVLLFIFLIIFSIFLPYIRSIYSTPILNERNAIIILPFIILLIGVGVHSVKSIIVRKIIILFIVIISIYQLYDKEYYTKVSKQQWRSVLYEVKSRNTNELEVYDIVYNSELYKNYAKVLGIKIKIKSKKDFLKEVENMNKKTNFWLLDAHENNFATISKLIGLNFIKVDSIIFKNARAYKIEKY